MAGYVISLDSEESLSECFNKGVYGTFIKNTPTNNLWKIPFEGTMTDYLSMKKGDFIFFFIKRKIYGIGKLRNITNNEISDCKFLNYPNADEPREIMNINQNLYLDNINTKQRIICTFEPSPSFYENGIDMDDVLLSNPKCFKMLRAFWKLSFIKLDDDESTCLFNIILKRNYLSNNVINSQYINYHSLIENKLNNNYLLNSNKILLSTAVNDKIRHEMAIEAALTYQLSTNDQNTTETFGNIDYISHQVIASPFKPIDYMDKMDIFSYSYIPGYKTKNKFKVIELKKDNANHRDIDQLLKYVDWIKDEYSGQDYSSIEAYLVAYSFSENLLDYIQTNALRNYSIGNRPVITQIWNNIKLVTYRYNHTNSKLEFTLIN